MKTNIPGNDKNNRTWPPIHSTDEEDKKILLSVLKQDNWSNGSFVKEFERQIADFMGCQHALFVVNGTAALKISLLGIGVKPGDEIIVPGMTWPSVVFVVLEVGAIPVTVDIDDGYGMSISEIKKAISPRTKAIIATHLFCSQTDLPPVLELAQANGIDVIEDATHVPGTIRWGKYLGTFGTAGFLSFNQKKNLSCGEGGCLLTNGDALIERARLLREVLPDRQLFAAGLPQSAKGSDFLAALLISQLKKFPDRLKILESRADYLREQLDGIEGVDTLATLPGTERQTYYNFCFKVKNVRDISRFRQALSKELSLSISAPYIPLSQGPALAHIIKENLYGAGQTLSVPLKNTLKAYAEGVRFHHHVLYDSLESMEDIVRAVKKILKFCQK
jgi:dTDP-4-amino-4,6-dideoxygalactose transaminase